MDKKTEKVIRSARELGIVNEVAVRNLHIWHKYKKLRSGFVKYEDAVRQLAEEYFLSFISIERIVCKQKKNGNA